MKNTKKSADELDKRLEELERISRRQAARIESLRYGEVARWPSIRDLLGFESRADTTASAEQARRIRELEAALAEARATTAEPAPSDTTQLESLRAEVERLRNAAAMAHDDSELQMEIGFLKHQLEESRFALSKARDAAADPSDLERLSAELERARAESGRALGDLRRENAELREQLGSMLSQPMGPSEDSALHSEISLLRDQLEIEKSKQGAPANDSALRAEIVALQEQLEAAKLMMESSGDPPRDHIAEIGALTHQLQQQLLELEQLRSSQTDLNRLVEEWRSRARQFEKTNKEIKMRQDHATQRLEAERQAVEELRGRIKSLEATVHSQKKDLARAEAREQHLRQHLKRSG